MTALEIVHAVAFANVHPTDDLEALEAMGIPISRNSSPTTGGNDGGGPPTTEKLTDWQTNDPSGRPWVAITFWPTRSEDEVQGWFGPVVDENDDYIVLDLGYGPTNVDRIASTFAKSRITHIRRAA